jgi:uncharacterized damage-inducible protein DinB
MSNHQETPTDPFLIALEHNAWATHAVLEACTSLGDDHWHRRFEMGPGSLHDTLTHVVSAMFRWADRIDGPPCAVRPPIEVGSWRTPAELITLLEQATADLQGSAGRARERGLETVLDVTLGGQDYRLTLGSMLVHVTTHGMHHRAQCLSMLRQLAVPGTSDRLPEIDVLEWHFRSVADSQNRGSMPSAGA